MSRAVNSGPAPLGYEAAPPADLAARIAERQAASPQARGERWANWCVATVFAIALLALAAHLFAH